jgi:hypothetical protein
LAFNKLAPDSPVIKQADQGLFIDGHYLLARFSFFNARFSLSDNLATFFMFLFFPCSLFAIMQPPILLLSIIIGAVNVFCKKLFDVPKTDIEIARATIFPDTY